MDPHPCQLKSDSFGGRRRRDFFLSKMVPETHKTVAEKKCLDELEGGVQKAFCGKNGGLAGPGTVPPEDPPPPSGSPPPPSAQVRPGLPAAGLGCPPQGPGCSL